MAAAPSSHHHITSAASDHNFFERDFDGDDIDDDEDVDDIQDQEEEEDADDTGDYMPPGLQGHRVTLEGNVLQNYTAAQCSGVSFQ